MVAHKTFNDLTKIDRGKDLQRQRARPQGNAAREAGMSVEQVQQVYLTKFLRSETCSKCLPQTVHFVVQEFVCFRSRSLDFIETRKGHAAFSLCFIITRSLRLLTCLRVSSGLPELSMMTSARASFHLRGSCESIRSRACCSVSPSRALKRRT